MPRSQLDYNEPTDAPVRATITVTEAAQVLGISRSTAYELVRVGTLPSLRLGRRLVVPKHALAELLESPGRPSEPGTEVAGGI
ncbi:MAG: helix-turn-helix domain-containing protein [Actinomycetia bacterium]|nr:helix-turn-helix domain-containing protein [Actinomycetes bacterium]